MAIKLHRSLLYPTGIQSIRLMSIRPSVSCFAVLNLCRADIVCENRIDLIVFNKSCVLILFNISVCSFDKIRLQYHQRIYIYMYIYIKALWYHLAWGDQSHFTCSFFFISDCLLLEYEVISCD